jgi:hypothetical protein
LERSTHKPFPLGHYSNNTILQERKHQLVALVLHFLRISLRRPYDYVLYGDSNSTYDRTQQRCAIRTTGSVRI